MKPTRQPGVGRLRKSWRIKEYLDSLNMNQAMIAERLGISRPVVYDTVRGKRNNRRVLLVLRELGCPESYLDLPEDAKKFEAA